MDAWEHTDCPVLLIGMDTPQVSVADLECAAVALLSPGVDAILGPADDGGYWLIGTRRPVPGMFAEVPMSTDRTAFLQRKRLEFSGPVMHAHPRAARRGHHRRRSRGGGSRPRFYLRRDLACLCRRSHGAESCLRPSSDHRSSGPLDGRTLELDVRRWMAPADQVDEALLDRAIGPVLDVGCGPGRHVSSLLGRGTVAMGIDTSPTAVRLARERGARVAHQSVFDAVPDAGMWRCALLLDGSIGIGGDPEGLLRAGRRVALGARSTVGGNRTSSATDRAPRCADRNRREHAAPGSAGRSSHMSTWGRSPAPAGFISVMPGRTKVDTSPSSIGAPSLTIREVIFGRSGDTAAVGRR